MKGNIIDIVVITVSSMLGGLAGAFLEDGMILHGAITSVLFIIFILFIKKITS